MRLPPPRSWTSRTRLTVAIATVLVCGGFLLLATQYAVMSTLLEQTVSHVEVSAPASDGSTIRPENGELELDGEVFGSADVQTGPLLSHPDAVVATVLRRALLWSAVILIAFVGVAIGAAWLLARRSLRRVTELTAATDNITEHDLTQRLAIAGPDDEFKRLGDTIDTMIGRLQAAVESRDRFIANASHELRTPLATARTALQIPLREKRVPADLVPDIECAIEANRRSEELVSTLLEIARGRGMDELTTTTVDLDRLVTESLATHRTQIDERGLAVETQTAAVSVMGNELLLQRLVENLVANAVIHNVIGGWIRVDLDGDADRVQLTVKNSGPPYSSDEASRLTEPFHRGSHTRIHRDGQSGAGRAAGLGLGLTLCTTIVDLHGGRLSVAPAVGGGLRVTVDLGHTGVTSR